MNLMRKILVIICCIAYCPNSHTIITKVPFKLLEMALPNNPIILEAGGHIGQDTRWMATLWQDGTLHVFEPHPDSYKKLRIATENFQNVELYHMALSNTTGMAPLYLDGGDGGASSLLKPLSHINDAYLHCDLKQPYNATCTTVDEWAESNNVSTIDFFWIDVEGNELQLLQGASEMLDQVRAIYTEVNLREFWHNCTMYNTLKAWLKQKGFTEVWSDLAPNWNGNVVFINDKYKNLIKDYVREKGEDPLKSAYLANTIIQKS